MLNILLNMRQSQKIFYAISYQANLILPKQKKTRKQRIFDMYKKVTAHQEYVNSLGILKENIKQEPYKHTVNYNFEQYLNYTKQVQESVKLNEKKKQLEENPQVNRKNRKIYDKPKFDLDISNYSVWPIYEDQLLKEGDHSMKIVCKILASPKQIRHVFGNGLLPTRNSDATREYDFQDSQLSKYLVYDYRATTFYKPNKSDEFYENQDHILPRKRLQKRPTPEEFWSSDEQQPFRVNCTDYADFRKFRVWFLKKLETDSKDSLSYEQKLILKYGQYETYDDYNKDYILNAKPAVFSYDRSYFLEKGQKYDTTQQFQDKIKPAVRLDDSLKISLEQYIEIKRQEKEEQERITKTQTKQQ